MRLRTWILAILMTLSALLGTTACAAEGTGTETFAPDGFTYSGGSGKLTMECPQIELRDGRPWATLILNSANYPWVRVNGVQYDTEHPGKNSVAVIPVELNVPMEIVGLTTAMSEPHEITYSICVVHDAPENFLPGLTFLEQEETKAELLEILRYEDGYTLLRVKDAGEYLVVPEGAEIPGALGKEIRVISLPAENIYVEQEDLFAALPDTGAVTLTGFETEDAECVGAGADLKLPLLLKNKCSLALLGPDWADSRITGADGENAFLREDLDDEQAKALRSVCEALGEYAIPAFVDRSREEPTQEGRAVWAAVYEKLLVPARDGEEKN